MTEALKELFKSEIKIRNHKMNTAEELLDKIVEQVILIKNNDCNIIYGILYIEGIIKDLTRLSNEIEIRQDIIRKIDTMSEK